MSAPVPAVSRWRWPTTTDAASWPFEPSLSMLDELQRKRGDRGLVVSSFMNGATVMSDSPWVQARENSGPSLKKPGSTNRSTLVRAPREMLIHISTIWS